MPLPIRLKTWDVPPRVPCVELFSLTGSTGKKRDKEKVIAEMGKTMAAIRRDDPTFNISGDETMNTLLSELDRIEERITSFKSERKERLYPGKFSVHESADAL